MTQMFLKYISLRTYQHIICVFALTAVAICCSLRGKTAKQTLVSLLEENSYVLEVENGHLSGEGFDFLMKAADEAQFVAIAEEQNRLQIPQVTSMLFSALHDKYGFNYLALEQGSVVGRMFASIPLKGDLEAIAKFTRKYTNAPTFITDQELQLIADAGRLSDAVTCRIWRLDQEFGALHILDQLKELAPNDKARIIVQMLVDKALPYEGDRFASEKLYMADVAKSEEFIRLHDLFQPKTCSKEAFFIENLLFSSRVYNKNVRARNGELTGFDANLEREENMKKRFMTEYRAAQKAGHMQPKVASL